MLNNLKRMVIFSTVVDTGSFSAAARKLGIVKSAVSKHVSLLEQHTGTRLLNRTTRGMSLTEIGETYYDICTRIVEAAEEAKRCTSNLQDEPHGTLKIAAPLSIGARHIAPLLNKFLKQYPDLKAELTLNDNVVDMVKENIDVAIRVGWLPDSSLRVRKLRDAKRMLCASPEYLKERGIPYTLDDLTQHKWIIFTLLPTPYHCGFTGKNGIEKTVQVKGRIKTNNSNAMKTLLLEGAGIGAMVDMLVAEEIKKGKLVQLLPDFAIPDAGVYALYQDQQLLQAKTRKFIDFLVRNMSF